MPATAPDGTRRYKVPTWLATTMGTGAIALWGTLAVLTALSGPIPPLQLTAMSFAIATAVGIAFAVITGARPGELVAAPAASLALGVYGLLGFHAAYFLAVKSAPPLEVTIINYAWPLLIVLFSALLPRELGGGPLRWWHITGAALGFAGAASVPLASGGALELSGTATGYLAAAASALIWSSYSVASRLFGAVPTSAVATSCGLTAVGALILHLAFEVSLWPLDGRQWAVVAACGLGPVGIAFYLWDVGMKHGDIRLLGVASYATPLIATGLLMVSGYGDGNPLIWLSAALVVAGALIAASDRLRGSGGSRKMAPRKEAPVQAVRDREG